MAQTVIRGTQILNNTVQRQDLDTSTVGQAVVTKIVQGAGITLSATGADSGTGDVTVAASVPAGPPGPTGAAGLNAFNITSGGFTVPPVGSTVTVTLNDASWVVVGQMIYCDQAGGGVGQAGALQVTAKTGNQITLLTPTPAPAIPPADATQAGLLKQLSGNTTDFVDGTNTCQNLATAIQPTIWSVRLRSFNAIGNPTFEVAQRNCRVPVVNPAQGTFIEDRWTAGNLGSLNQTYTCAQAGTGAGLGVVIPGTSYAITVGYMQIKVGTQKASLAAGDLCAISQTIEGPCFRELMNDVHSFSILCRSTVANLKFGVSFRDPAAAKSLTKLCTLGAANTITLIQLPNLLAWPAAGNFSALPGSAGYSLNITVACGSTYTSPANDTWQNGNFVAALGQDNLMASAVGSTFEAFVVQHEPGPLCTTPIDKPFTQNYDECLRYYTKSYAYATTPGTATQTGSVGWQVAANLNPVGYVPFKRVMAKIAAALSSYSISTGAVNTIRDTTAGVDRAVTGASGPGDSGFYGWALGTVNTGLANYLGHYTADTGW